MSRSKARISAIHLRSNERGDIQLSLDTIRDEIENEFARLRTRIKDLEALTETNG